MSKKKIIGITIAVIVGLIIVLGLIFFKIDDISEAFKRVEEINATKEYRDKGLEELPEIYTLEQAVKDGCFVVTHNKIYNKDKLDRFIENTGINSQNRIEDKIRIVQFTIEGDPIITDLEYKITDETYLLSGKPVNKTKYIMKVDNTRDEFAATEDRKITEDDDIPGEIYGITTVEKDNMVQVVIALYAELQYVSPTSKIYDDIEVCAYSKNAEVVNKTSIYDTDKITITKNNTGEKLDSMVDITGKTEIDNIISKCNSIIIKDINYEPMILGPDYEISFNNGVELWMYESKDIGWMYDGTLHEAYGLGALDSIIEQAFAK